MKTPKAVKLPSGSWNVRLRVRGEDYSITRSTEAEAIAEAMAIKAGIKQAEPTLKNVTLAYAIDNYIAARKAVLSPATIRSYRTIRNNRLRGAMSLPIRTATKAQWQAAINAEARDGVSAKTVRNVWGLVSAVLKDNGIPVPDIRLPAQMPNEHPYLNPQQIPIFLQAAKGDPAELAILLGLHGLRRSEICALTWQDIDLKQKLIKIHRALVLSADGEWVAKRETKNASSTRNVPILIDRLAELLAERKQSEARIITRHPNSIYNAVNRICAANDLPLIGTHGLRHSFASLCQSRGVPEKTTMLLGGWSDFQTMRKRYTHFSQDEIRGHVDSLRDFFRPEKQNDDKNDDK